MKIKLRPEVQLFAEAMERTLRRNDHKKHWSSMTQKYLLRNLRVETRELAATLKEYNFREYVQSEAIDVANYAMMIWDNSKAKERGA